MLVSIGHNYFMESDRVVAILEPNSSPSKKKKRDAAEKGLIIDARGGGPTRSLLILDTNHVILCSLQAETLKSRLNANAFKRERNVSSNDGP
ncbi:MAG: DUF370 domain-containing protein [Thermodesulfobacteriota bacterium]|jgi:regulator of extracellular matrix RemA (YlzA/DUF370 family)